jgi:apolipoprotein N-acyltransferase
MAVFNVVKTVFVSAGYPLAAAIFGGFALALALPPHNYEFLAFMAFAPLIAAASPLRPLVATGLGLLSGLMTGAVYIGWNPDTMRLFWAYLPFLWVGIILAILCFMASRIRDARSARRIIVLGAAATAIEFATMLLPIPINIAIAVYKTPLVPLATLTGIWGISSLIWLSNAALADIILQRKIRRPHVIFASILAASCLFGYISKTRPENPDQHIVTVAAIQDFDSDETGKLAPEPSVPVDRNAMTIAAASGKGAQKPDVIVWSEECLGSGFVPDNPYDQTVKLARKIDTPLVVGYNDNAHPKPHNCAAWLAPSGKLLGVHHKEHLYLGENQMIQAGRGGEAFETPLGKVGLEICFDTAFTNVTRDAVRQGAGLILMPNYDPPTPRGVLHYLHGALITYRAAENHVPIARCDSNGVSQVIDHWGNVISQGPLYAPAIVIGSALVTNTPQTGTFYTHCGDWFVWLCVAASLYFLTAKNKKPLRRS